MYKAQYYLFISLILVYPTYVENTFGFIFNMEEIISTFVYPHPHRVILI